MTIVPRLIEHCLLAKVCQICPGAPSKQNQIRRESSKAAIFVRTKAWLISSNKGLCKTIRGQILDSSSSQQLLIAPTSANLEKSSSSPERTQCLCECLTRAPSPQKEDSSRLITASIITSQRNIAAKTAAQCLQILAFGIQLDC